MPTEPNVIDRVREEQNAAWDAAAARIQRGLQMNDERIELDGGGQLHIFLEDDWKVWLNVESDFTGLCIGIGKTRAAAVKDAATELLGAVNKLINTTARRGRSG